MPALATLAAVLVPDAARAQAPVPVVVAEERIDINADGAPDIIQLMDPAAVSIVLGAPGTPGVRVEPADRADAGAQVVAFAEPPESLRGGHIQAAAAPRLGGTLIVVTARFAVDRPGDRGGPGGPDARRGRLGERAIALLWRGAGTGATALWEGAVGSQGGDGEYAVRLEPTAEGLLRYQHRPDVQRCDGEPTYLFPERYDARSRRFRPVYNMPRMPAAAPVLQATRAAPAHATDQPAAAFRSQATSAQEGARHAGELAAPRELDDGSAATVWREGLGGDGRGELITFTSPLADPEIVAIRLIPGDAGSEAAFRRGNRLRRLGLLVGTGHAFWIELGTDPARQSRFDQPWWVILPAGVRGRCVTVIIGEVYRGGQGGQGGASAPGTGVTAISDLAVLTDLDLATGDVNAALVDRVLAGGRAGDAAARLLAGRGQPGAAAIVAALIHRDGDLGSRQMLALRRVLARIGDPGDEVTRVLAAAELARALAAPDAISADRVLYIQALQRMGNAAVEPLAVLLAPDSADGDDGGGADPAARRAGVQALAGVPGPAAQDALARALGHGSRSVRKAASMVLGRRPPAELGALLDKLGHARDSGARGTEADLWRALGLMARRSPTEAGARLDPIMAERLAGQWAADDYELAYRLVEAAAAAGLARTLPALATALGALGGPSGLSPARADALRRVSARALAANPAPAARALLIELSADRDPGTRASAIDALGQRSDATPAGDAAVMARLHSDRWPRIRSQAASALGRRCGTEPAPRSALTGALGADASAEVRRAAIGALVACRAPGIGATLLAVAADREQMTEVREHAIVLVPTLGDRALAPDLIALFASLRKQAWSGESALGLAAAAAVSLGRLSTAEVVEPLLAAARDGTYPELQAAALTGLGEMCPARAIPIFERMMHNDEPRVATAARGALSQCGGSRDSGDRRP